MLSPLVIATVVPSLVGAFNTQQVGRPSTALNKFKKVKWTPQTGSHVSIPPYNPHHGVGDNGPTSYAPSNYGESGGVNIQQQPTSSAGDDSYGFVHAPLDYFAFDNLSSKGPRATFDWGEPQDWSRKLADDGVFRGGTWYCTEGGWESPNGKAVTEVFYMLEGHGMLGDSDGTKHYFGPGDMVIIPKGHTGKSALVLFYVVNTCVPYEVFEI